MNPAPTDNEVHFRAVTANTLADLDRFSSEHGKFRYCSCMRWRMTSTEFRRSDKQGHIEALNGRVDDGHPVGVSLT